MKDHIAPGRLLGPALMSLLLVPACVVSAQTLDDLMLDVHAARSFDYCAWIAENRDTLAEQRPDHDVVIENTDRRYSERQVAAAVLVAAGLDVADKAGTPRRCARAFKRGEKLFDDAMHEAHRTLRNQADFERSDDPAIANVQADLSAHWLDDQVARQAYIELQTDDTEGERYWARQRAVSFSKIVDARASDYIMRVLESYDWIDIERFGTRVSKFAWLLVQHADHRPQFQALALERMQPHLDKGTIKPANYAHLWDRVAVNSGREQRYGTQPVWKCTNRRLQLEPLEDPANVNARRAKLGLDSVESGLARMSAEFCR
jgi:hypothetical protein